MATDSDKSVGHSRLLWRAVTGCGLVGIVLLVVGPFLPWVMSGSVSRNIYAVSGIIERLDAAPTLSPVIDALAVAGAVCVLPAILAALAWRRAAAVVAIIVSIAYFLGAVVVIVLVDTAPLSGVNATWAGPATVMVGAACLAAAAMTALVLRTDTLDGTSRT